MRRLLFGALCLLVMGIAAIPIPALAAPWTDHPASESVASPDIRWSFNSPGPVVAMDWQHNHGATGSGATTKYSFLLDRGRITPIARPGAAFTVPDDINDGHLIFGQYLDAAGTSHGFLLERGHYTTIDPPGASGAGTSAFFQFPGTIPGHVNNRGQAVGTYTDAAGIAHGFLVERGHYTTIEVPGALQTSVNGINDRGEIVGSYLWPDGIVHGFLLDRADHRNNPRRYTTIDYHGAPVTSLSAINNRHQIVGYSIDANGQLHAWQLDGRRFTTVAPPGALDTVALDINDHGDIVGAYDEGPGGTTLRGHGFLRTSARYTTIDAPGNWLRTEATGINNQGSIVGFADNGSGELGQE